MGNKKVYLGSAILLLAAAVVGVGLWLQHRAEQKREERKNAIYGYWMTENPMTERPMCIEINKERVVLSNWWSPAKSTYIPTATSEPIVTINDDGKVMVTATLSGDGKEEFMFSLATDNLDRMKIKMANSPESPVTLKKISEKAYYTYWQPLKMEDWQKARHFVDSKGSTTLGVKFLNPKECVFYFFHAPDEKQTIMGKFPILTCQGASQR